MYLEANLIKLIGWTGVRRSFSPQLWNGSRKVDSFNLIFFCYLIGSLEPKLEKRMPAAAAVDVEMAEVFRRRAEVRMRSKFQLNGLQWTGFRGASLCSLKRWPERRLYRSLRREKWVKSHHRN